MSDTRQTKWTLISESERTALENTPFGGACSGCSEPLATEADFAKHFTIPDARFKNVGYCPEKGPVREDKLW